MRDVELKLLELEDLVSDMVTTMEGMRDLIMRDLSDMPNMTQDDWHHIVDASYEYTDRYIKTREELHRALEGTLK